MNVFAQFLSILGLSAQVGSFQQKKKGTIIIWQLFASLLFAIHFFMIGAFTGALLNSVNILRCVVFSFKGLNKNRKNIYIGIFCVLYVAVYLATFLVFKTDFNVKNALIEILPTIGMCFVVVSYGMTSAKIIRIFGGINSPLWLIYNIFHVSIGGILCEVLCMISIVVGIFRHDIKKKASVEPKEA